MICIKWKCSREKYEKTNERGQTICSSLCAAVSVTRSGLTVSDTDSKSFKKLLGMSHISSEQQQWKREEGKMPNVMNVCNPASGRTEAPIAFFHEES